MFLVRVVVGIVVTVFSISPALGVCAAGKITSSTSHQMAQNASESDGRSHREAFLWHRSRTMSHHEVP